MTAFLIIPIIILLFVTPFGMSLRGMFNTARKYLATNLTLLGFLLTMKIRLKIENNNIYYSINNKQQKIIETKKDKAKTNIKISKYFNNLVINKLDIKIKYGVNDNAMRTAIESSAIYNVITFLSKFIKVNKLNIEVNSDYNSDIFSADIDIKTRFALLQIILISVRILIGRRQQWKTSKT